MQEKWTLAISIQKKSKFVRIHMPLHKKENCPLLNVYNINKKNWQDSFSSWKQLSKFLTINRKQTIQYAFCSSKAKSIQVVIKYTYRSKAYNHSLAILILKKYYLFIWLHQVLLAACGIFFSCSTWTQLQHMGSSSPTRDWTWAPWAGNVES